MVAVDGSGNAVCGNIVASIPSGYSIITSGSYSCPSGYVWEGVAYMGHSGNPLSTASGGFFATCRKL